MSVSKILIVDDDDGVRMTLAELFTNRGYSVENAACGLDAVDLIDKIDFEVAIIDINLPDINGIALLKKIKENHPDMVCAIITGSASLQYAIEALKENADGFFIKPPVMEEVFLRIESALDKKQIEHDLLISNELPRTILNSINEAVSIIDANDFTVKMVNNNFINALGIPEEKVIGQTCHKLIYNRDTICQTGATGCPMQETLRSGRHVSHEMLHHEKTSREQYVEITTSPIFDEHGKIIQVVHVSRDITDRKKLEMSLATEKNNLKKTNSELKKAYNELKSTQAKVIQQEKMASIGALAAGVAHEINNPMGFITSNLTTLGKYSQKFADFITLQADAIKESANMEQMLHINQQRKKLKIDYLLEDISDLIDESLEGADRVKTIVQNLKSFARVDDNKPVAANLNDCLTSTLNIVWNELKYKAEVSKDFGEIPMVRCFPQQINQVFMNLLVNAAHAIADKGEINIKTESKNGTVLVSISDTGCGIPQKNIARIFEPFFTTKEAGKGTGLGMSIAYDIVKKHNGDISVQSEVGKGSTFTVSLLADSPA